MTTEHDDDGSEVGGTWRPDDGGDPQPERREHERIECSAMMRIIPAVGDEIRKFQAINVSMGGMLLLNDDQPPPGVGRMVEVMISGPDGSLTLDGEVVRHEGESFAVRYINVDDERREGLRNFVGAAEEGRSCIYG